MHPPSEFAAWRRALVGGTALALAATFVVGTGSGRAAAETVRAAAEQADALCRTFATLPDPAADGRSWMIPPRVPWRGTPAGGDLRRFEIGSGSDGVCARWTLAAAPPAGTQLVVLMRAPPVRSPGGATISWAYGWSASLTPTGATLTYGLDRLDSRAPRVLRGRILRTGRIVTIYVPRSELDRPPANMTGRPRFPFRRFTYEARALSPLTQDGAQSVDFAPQERAPDAPYPSGA